MKQILLTNICILYIHIYIYMFASLSTVILYLWSINNDISIPIIIPLLLLLRDLGILLPKNNILSKIFNLQSSTGRNIEYYLAFISSILIIIYYYYFRTQKKFKNYLKLIFFTIICIFSFLLVINLFTL